MSDEANELETLVLMTRALLAAIDIHLANHPSPRLAHHRPTFLLAALERDLATQQAPHYDPHVLAMARKLGIPPEDFVRLQEVRREGMRDS